MRDKVDDKPNIFEFATSESSQDAFFCWLLEWSKEIYFGETLNEISLKFINHILNETCNIKLSSIEKIEIYRQEKHIDFYCLINDNYVIVFEDKISTQMHDNQLAKYKEHINNKFGNKIISFVYIKTDILFAWEEWRAKQEGYFIIDMDTIICLLNENCENEIFNQFISVLKKRKKSYNQYTITPVKNWCVDDWLGFVHYINYNIDGSFFGRHYKGDDTWWLVLSKRDDKDNDISLTLEITKKECVIKSHFENDEDKHKILETLMNKDIPTILPAENYKYDFLSSFKGKNLTICYIKNYIMQNNDRINLQDTLKRVKDIVCRFNDYYDSLWE
jgi:hypothetical protein